MDAWFARYFSSRGIPIILSDARVEEARAVASTIGAEVAKTNSDAVMGVDVALICVPIDKTWDVVLETAPHMKQGSTLVEVSSIKGQTINLLQSLRLRVSSLSQFTPSSDQRLNR